MISQIHDLNDNFEVDPETHWVKAFSASGDFYLFEPRAVMQLALWARQRRMDLYQAQEAADQQKGTQDDKA